MSVLKKYNSITSQWDSIVVGSSGPQGAQGAQGGNGAQGAQGPQGAPGATVVTSTTRPSSPTTGQLIFETDTMRLAAYNGSGWVTQNSLQLITTVALSGASTSVNNCFSSRYDNYLLVCGDIVLNNTTLREVRLRLRASGTDSSSAVYSREIVGAYAASVFSGQGTDTHHILNAVVDSTLRMYFTAEIMNPFAAAPTGIQSVSYGYRNGGGNQWWSQSCFHTANTSYDGFTILTDTQSITSGTVYVYGMSKV